MKIIAGKEKNRIPFLYDSKQHYIPPYLETEGIDEDGEYMDNAFHVNMDIFNNLAELIGGEIDSKELGYFSFAVSIFDGWLSRENYSEAMKEIQTKRHEEVSAKRVDFLTMFYEGAVMYNNKTTVSFESKQDYITKISKAIYEEREMVLLNADFGLVINITYDYTDILHFKDKKYINKISKGVSENGLSMFDY